MELRNKINIEKYTWSIVVFWTIAIILSFVWNINRTHITTQHNTWLQARVAFEKDVLYRRWNAQHGGVYVPVSDKAETSPYLEGRVLRDIINQVGDTLTMLNPAYMTRQVHEIAMKESGVQGHITSLKPIRPENAPDDWETKALQAFEDGSKEIYSIELINGVQYYRYMQPLVTEEGCLQCHALQGYSLGDIRGGISVSIPMEPLFDIMYAEMNRIGVGHGILWIIGIIGIIIGKISVHKKEVQRQISEKKLRESNIIKELLLDIITHDLKNPAGIVMGFSELMTEQYPDEEMAGLIKSGSESILKVIDNATILSQVAIGDEIQKQELNLIEVIKEVSKEYQTPLKEASMTMELKLPEALIVEANPIISEVFKNYVSNAIKYAKKGKKIIVEILEEQDWIIIAVKDFGDVIPVKERQVVFDRKFQLDKGEKLGRGLGLSIVRRIAEAHNAEVGVKPNRPKGNIFYIKLPIK